MSQLKAYLENFRQFIISLLARIEDSPQFEKAVMTFESLDPRIQRRIRAGSVLVLLVSLGLFLLVPVIPVFRAKSVSREYRSLISEMARFNATANVIVKPAPRPAGWSALPTATIDDVENSITQYFANIGVPQDLVELNKSGNRLTMKMEQISIKQVVYLVFQLDGWYPALVIEKLSINVNREKADLLDFAATISFDPAEGAKLQSLLGMVTPNGSSNSADSGFNSAQGDTGLSGGDSGSSSGMSDFDYPPPPPPPDGDFGGDLPPPPPFEEDL